MRQRTDGRSRSPFLRSTSPRPLSPYWIEGPHKRFDRERKHAGNTKLWPAVNEGLALVRKVAFLKLRAPLRADVFCFLSVDPNVDAVGAVLIEESVRELAAALQWRVGQEHDAVRCRGAGDQFGINLLGAALVDPDPIDRFGLHLLRALLEDF